MCKMNPPKVQAKSQAKNGNRQKVTGNKVLHSLSFSVLQESERQTEMEQLMN